MSGTYLIMIACVTTETVMVSEPVGFYRPSEVHLFRYTRDPGTAKAKLYDDHYREARRQIRACSPETEIIEHSEDPIYDFRSMARCLESLNQGFLKEHPECTVLANISSGPSEFTAALEFLATLNPNVRKFKVATKEYALDESEFSGIYYVDGRPTGLSRSVYPPREIESVHLGKPDEILVKSLRIYSGMIDRGVEPTTRRMVEALKSRGLWVYKPLNVDWRCPQEYREKANFDRRYRAMWKAMGWIDANDRKKCHRLTEQGKAVIEMFYVKPKPK